MASKNVISRKRPKKIVFYFALLNDNKEAFRKISLSEWNKAILIGIRGWAIPSFQCFNTWLFDGHGDCASVCQRGFAYYYTTEPVNA